MNFLVTGGAGFIGSRLCEVLIEKGHKVICYDNFDDFYSEERKQNNIKELIPNERFTLIHGDIRNNDTLSKVFSKFNIEIVIHLAAKAGVRPSLNNPLEYFDVNVLGTVNLLEVMRMYNVDKMIFASSSSVYGNNKKTPYSETDNVDFPISPYAASKKSGELITYNYHHLYNFKIINLRFFTVFGPRQRPDLAIYKFFKSIYSNSPIDLYGEGNTSRDYTYVDDIVNGVSAAIDYLNSNEKVFETINLGNSHPVILSDLIEMIEKIAGKKFSINKLPMQQGDVNHTYADIDKARKILNYDPYTSLSQGLINFKNWYEKTKL
jgi:UDP-glucuronate 4-epimerase